MAFPRPRIPHWGDMNFPMQLVVNLRAWINELAPVAYIPPKAIMFFNLSSTDLTSYFVNGVGRGEYVGWLICDGTNDTPNLVDKFVRVTSGAAGGTGGSDSSAHTHSTPAHKHLTDVGFDSTNLYFRSDSSTTPFSGDEVISSQDRLSFTHGDTLDTGSVRVGYTNTDGGGTTGAASVTDNRPAFYQLTALMRA